MAQATTQSAKRPRGLFRRRSPVSDSEDSQSPVPGTSSNVPSKSREAGASESRRWRRANGRRLDSEPQADVSRAESAPEKAEAEDSATKPKRRRGSRGGRRHRRPTEAGGTTAKAQAAAAVDKAAPPARPTRRPQPKKAPSESRQAPEEKQPRPVLTKARARIPVTGAPTEHVPAPFAHNAEYEFARILDFYGIDWQYEPRSFPLRWERGHVTEAFTPDFYLPDLTLYVELTTLKSSLTAEKNRKMRLLKELYPEVNVIMLKKRDYLRLLAKYGYGPLSPDQVPDIDRVLITASKLQQRVGQLGAQISRDYAGKEPVLIGVLRGVICFISDLMRHISVPSAVDLMAISSYEGNGAGAVRILKDIDENIKGRDVILVEDIVDTGMTLNHVIDYLQTKRPASIRVCTLLDKRARRIVNVPLDYVAFEIPDEFVVGYGLDFHQRFRNLPFIAVLKHELLPCPD